MRELNRTYRHIDRSTDVLSFASRGAYSPLPEEEALGDIVISVETAARQAEERGHSFDAEVELLIVHGMLHLLGHEHVEADERRRMQAMERRVLKRIRK